MISPEIIRQNRIVYLRMPKKYLPLYKKFKVVEVKSLKYAKKLKYEGQTIVAYTPWDIDMVWMVWFEKKRGYNFLGQSKSNLVPLVDLIDEKINLESKNSSKKAGKLQIESEVVRKFGAEILHPVELPLDLKKAIKFLKFFSESRLEVRKVLIALMYKTPKELAKDKFDSPVDVPEYTERWYKEMASKAGGYRFIKNLKPTKKLLELLGD